MKRAGDLLSTFLDEKLLNKARGYSRLFLFWTRITQKYGIAAASDHSQILDIQRGILIIEADHPGWIQILQTQEHRLLADLQHQFPELEIAGLSFKLSRLPFQTANTETETEPDTLDGSSRDGSSVNESSPDELPEDSVSPDDADRMATASTKVSPNSEDPYEKIKDEDFRNILKSLEKSITENSAAGKKKKGKDQKKNV
jgi:hypothetical protein